MQYLYNDGSDYIFMDGDTYDQISVSPDVVGDAAKYLLENQDALVARHDGNVLFIELPGLGRPRDHLHRAGPAGRPLHRRHQAGDRRDPEPRSRCPSSSRRAPRSRVDTRDGSYLGRVN
jgi:elongation factor P